MLNLNSLPIVPELIISRKTFKIKEHELEKAKNPNENDNIIENADKNTNKMSATEFADCINSINWQVEANNAEARKRLAAVFAELKKAKKYEAFVTAFEARCMEVEKQLIDEKYIFKNKKNESIISHMAALPIEQFNTLIDDRDLMNFLMEDNAFVHFNV